MCTYISGYGRKLKKSLKLAQWFLEMPQYTLV